MNYLHNYNDSFQNKISFDIYFSRLNMWTQTRVLFAKIHVFPFPMSKDVFFQF